MQMVRDGGRNEMCARGGRFGGTGGLPWIRRVVHEEHPGGFGVFEEHSSGEGSVGISSHVPELY